MKTLSALAIVILFASCKGNDLNSDNNTNTPANDSLITNAARDTGRYTTIQWQDSVIDLGKMKYGDFKEIKFKFTNTGNYPLFVIAADPSCGCTVADYPKEAIAPGKDGVITAGYDTQNQHVGQVRKTIIVTTNTKDQVTHTLLFSGEIFKEGESAPPEQQPIQNENKKEIKEKLIPETPKKN